MKILLVYPLYPLTFWSFKYALTFISRHASLPPLGLMTVAAMLPTDWEVRLVDKNVKKLQDKDLSWAIMFYEACRSRGIPLNRLFADKSLGVKIIAGGPLFTSVPDEFKDVDHLILNEAEITLPLFLRPEGRKAERIYTSPNGLILPRHLCRGSISAE
jgi:radical SAM superfamily enzyme YgiQ (UPF0313 family)